MYLRKRQYQSKKTGERKTVQRWTVRFQDHFDRWVEVPAFKDRKASEGFGRQLEKLASIRAAGEQPDTAMIRWLEGLSRPILERLEKFDLLASHRLAATKSLQKHVKDWKISILAQGASNKYANLLESRVRRLIKECSFRRYSDISAEKVQHFFKDIREVENISPQTVNFYLSHIKQFCRWMCRNGRATSNPLEHLSGFNVRVDRRHDRRALTVDEACRLLEVTAKGPVQQDIPGPARALLYRLAMETGLRLNELRSLRKSSFDLNSNYPTVTVGAAYSKHKRDDILPIRKDTAELLRLHLALKIPDAPAFALREWMRGADMIRADLEIAGIPYRDASGCVVDFHALRHTFITNLANGGVHPKVAQTLARHSTITLTMDRYTHTLQEQELAAIAKLPDLSAPARATGTGN